MMILQKHLHLKKSINMQYILKKEYIYTNHKTLNL